jgi:hypothetical protein
VLHPTTVTEVRLSIADLDAPVRAWFRRWKTGGEMGLVPHRPAREAKMATGRPQSMRFRVIHDPFPLLDPALIPRGDAVAVAHRADPRADRRL